MTINRLNSADADFRERFAALRTEEAGADPQVEQTVRDIIADIRERGDAALLDYTKRFDRYDADSVTALEVPAERRSAALKAIPDDIRLALEQAAENLRGYAEHQKLESWSYTDANGNLLGQQVSPLSRVGLYVPGGKAAYPSSVLMNAIPAKVAEVPEVVMVAPMPDGQLNDLVLAAAEIAGVDRVFTIGGAQAVAALAYGTETVPMVDKIVGPGNIYVATAKRFVFGQVGIDMIAGPSEVLIVGDGSANPDWLAMDLFAQAEHDENAQSVLVSTSVAELGAVAASIDKLLPTMNRADIIAKALAKRGALILAKDIEDALSLINDIAPEHLELALVDPNAVVERITHAGAIFVGAHTAESLGDYCAGPNHVLPTGRTARFSSPLGVYDFQKRSSVIQCSPAGSAALAPIAATLARGEGLDAHARSAEYRGE